MPAERIYKKVPGENFLLLISRTCRFIFYVELSSLWTVNNTIFCLFRFLYISYGRRITQYFPFCFILHQLGTANNAVFCLFCFLSPPTGHPNLEVFLSSVEEELFKDIKVPSFEIISLVKNGEQ